MRDVDDGDRVGARLASGHGAVEQLAEDQRLGGPLLEPAQVDQSRWRVTAPASMEVTRVIGQEDPPPRLHLDDQPDNARRTVVARGAGHDVADAADLVADRVEDRQAGKARHEDPRRAVHMRRLPALTPRDPARKGNDHADVRVA